VPFFARRPYLAWAVFLVGILLTMAMARSMARLQAQKITTRFEQEATEARDALEQRLQTYANLLKDLRGLYKLSNGLTRQQYFDYIDGLGLLPRYPGILGINFGVRVLPSELKAFEARMQAELGWQAQGRTFAVFPPGPRAEYYVVVFGMPEATNRSAVGFDSGSAPEQLESLSLARDTGLLQASGPLALKQDPEQGAGLILRLAVYRNGLATATVAERRTAFVGYANAVFRMKDLAELALTERMHQQATYTFRERPGAATAGPKGLGPVFFATGAGPARGADRGLARLWIPPLDTHRDLGLGGRMWDIEVKARPGYVTSQEQLQPLIVLLGGFLFSGALFALVRTLSTARRQAQELARYASDKLSDRDSQLDAISRVIPDLLFMLDEEGAYLSIFTADDKMLIAPRATLLQSKVADLLPPQVAAAVLATITAALATGDVQNYEYSMELPELGQRWFEARVAKLERRVGGKGCVVWVSRDVTERTLTEEHQRQAQKLESMGLMAGGIAHDFNNLLTAILGNLNLAQMHLEPGSRPGHFLDLAEKSVMKASALTRQMLAYSGKATLVVAPLDLNAVVEDMTSLLQVSMAKKSTLRLELAPDLPMVEGDAAQLQQVVMNLITNAAEAIGEAPGRILVCTAVLELEGDGLQTAIPGSTLAAGTYVTLEVSDDGCGMAPEVLARIFDPFYTTKVTGRGLGLSAMLGIVKKHQGAIKIYSEVGVGSTFRLFFPACHTEPRAEAMPEAEDTGPLSGTVLLVDDEAAVRDATGLALENLGLQVLMAADGQAALELFMADPGAIDLVLMDLTMPRMNGHECFHLLRAQRADLNIILSSGYNALNVDLQALDGLAGFLQKPYTLRSLRRLVRSCLAARPKP
jgi:signal transduction histidine kinase/CHASE1-domain containing sensor protein/CheY-like chemotaxis protein